MLLYGVAIATGPFQRKGMWSAAGSWREGGGGVTEDVGVGMGVGGEEVCEEVGWMGL